LPAQADPDLQPGDGIELAPPWHDQGGVGREVRDVGRDRLELCTEDAGEAHQGTVDVEIGERAAPLHHLVDPRGTLQEAEQRSLTGDQDLAAAVADEPGIPDELDGVAHPLLGVEQDRPALQRGAVPRRPGELAAGHPVESPPPLELGPAARVVAQGEPAHRAVPSRPGAAGLEPQGLLVVRQRLVRPPQHGQARGQVLVRLDMIGLELEGRLEAGDRLGVLLPAGQGRAQVVVRPGVSRVAPDGLAIAGDRLVEPPQDPEHVAQVAPGLGMVGADLQGAPEARLGLRELPLLRQHGRQVAQRGNLARFEPERLPTARRHVAQSAQGIGIIPPVQRALGVLSRTRLATTVRSGHRDSL
jgi:hypothetical protein